MAFVSRTRVHAQMHPAELPSWRLERVLMWKAIPGYQGKYEVNETGDVRNRKGRSIAQHPNSTGYPRVNLSDAGATRHVFVHRLVAEAFLEARPHCRVVNHKNGIKSDNRAANLEWVTYSGNAQHAVATGLNPVLRGEATSNSKLSADAVIDIRNRREAGERIVSIAQSYGLHRNTVYAIVSRARWGHVR